MKKVFKNPIFTFVLGIILTSTIIVFADNILASSITYKENSTVEEAIDDLYTKATTYKNLSTTTNALSGDLLLNKTAYDNNGNLITGSISTFTPSSSYTPTTNSQTLQTSGKYLDGDITINPIPSNYQILNGTANISSDKILSGYSAFDNSGTLVNGNLSTNCVNGNKVVTNDITTGMELVNFTPSMIFTHILTTYGSDINYYYNSNVDSNNISQYSKKTDSTTINTLAFSDRFIINNGKLYIYNTQASAWAGTTLYYTACQ